MRFPWVSKIFNTLMNTLIRLFAPLRIQSQMLLRFPHLVVAYCMLLLSTSAAETFIKLNYDRQLMFSPSGSLLQLGELAKRAFLNSFILTFLLVLLKMRLASPGARLCSHCGPREESPHSLLCCSQLQPQLQLQVHTQRDICNINQIEAVKAETNFAPGLLHD